MTVPSHIFLLRFNFILLLFLFTIGIYCTITRLQLRMGLARTLRALLLTGGDLLCLVLLYNSMLYISLSIPLPRFYYDLVFSPPLLLGLIALLLTAASAAALIATRYWRTRTITRRSIATGLDQLPIGFAISTPDGLLMQSNKKIDELCYIMSGTVLESMDAFRAAAAPYRVSENDYLRPRLAPGEAAFLAQLPNDSVWLMELRPLGTAAGPVTQLTAVDVSEEYALIQELQADNARLEEYNHRMRRYSIMIDDIVKREELLAARRQIHDRMGESLLAVKIFLKNENSPLSARDLVDRWKRNVSLLIEEASPEKAPDQLQRLRDAAAYLGVELIVMGKMPRDPEAMKLINAGVQECMTNAVKHARASQMYVSVLPEDGGWRVIYSSNGLSPSEPIREGGGLSLLRGMAERAGAQIEYDYTPRFSITMHIKNHFKEGDDPYV